MMADHYTVLLYCIDQQNKAIDAISISRFPYSARKLHCPHHPIKVTT